MNGHYLSPPIDDGAIRDIAALASTNFIVEATAGCGGYAPVGVRKP